MFPAVFGEPGGNGDCVIAHHWARKLHHLAFALPCENQHLHNPAERIAPSSIPDFDEFGVRENAFAGYVRMRSAHPFQRIAVDVVLAIGPANEGAQSDEGVLLLGRPIQEPI